jgi:hypothetical protein
MTTIVHRGAYRIGAKKITLGGVLYRSLVLAGWVATTALTTAGLLVTVFVLAGNGTLAGFFTQVDLLARHYLDADAARRATFDLQFWAVLGIVFVCTGFFRRTSLFAIYKRSGRWTT